MKTHIAMAIIFGVLHGLLGHIMWTSDVTPKWLAVSLPLSLFVMFILATIIVATRKYK